LRQHHPVPFRDGVSFFIFCGAVEYPLFAIYPPALPIRVAALQSGGLNEVTHQPCGTIVWYNGDGGWFFMCHLLKYFPDRFMMKTLEAAASL
jgi:hypothetical protein